MQVKLLLLLLQLEATFSTDPPAPPLLPLVQ